MVLESEAVCAEVLDHYTYWPSRGGGNLLPGRDHCVSIGVLAHQLPETPERAKSPCSWPCLKGVTRVLEQGHTPVGCSLGIWAGQVTKGPVGVGGQLESTSGCELKFSNTPRPP